MKIYEITFLDDEKALVTLISHEGDYYAFENSRHGYFEMQTFEIKALRLLGSYDGDEHCIFPAGSGTFGK